MIEAGTVLLDKYKLQSQLGSGGMGAVWLAEHLSLRAPVAVKLMAASIAQSPEALARFHREAQAAAALRGPHVVQILDHGVDPVSGVPFIIMEKLEGETLGERISREGLLGSEMTGWVIADVARAMTRAHELNIVHRDLKPDNIFLVTNDEQELAKVLDFGIAKADTLGAPGAFTQTGAVLGTAYYMSPEQIRGGFIDWRSDLWALGVIAHECLTGMRPFTADTIPGLSLKICADPIPPPSSYSAVPPGFDEWFAKAVNRDPSERFQGARELAQTLRELCRGPMSPATQRLTDARSDSLGIATQSAMTHSPVTRDSTPRPEPHRYGWMLFAGGLVLAGGVTWIATQGMTRLEEPAPASSSLSVAPQPSTGAAVALPPTETSAEQPTSTTPREASTGLPTIEPGSAGRVLPTASSAVANPPALPSPTTQKRPKHHTVTAKKAQSSGSVSAALQAYAGAPSQAKEEPATASAPTLEDMLETRKY